MTFQNSMYVLHATLPIIHVGLFFLEHPIKVHQNTSYLKNYMLLNLFNAFSLLMKDIEAVNTVYLTPNVRHTVQIRTIMLLNSSNVCAQ